MELLTGSTGFLGRHLARCLAAEGRKIRALVRAGTDLQRIPPEVGEIVWGSLDDPAAIARATHGIDTIYHTAARVSSGGNRQRFEDDNVIATEALLEAAEAAGVRRFIHVSSAGIYGAETRLWTHGSKNAGPTPGPRQKPIAESARSAKIPVWKPF